MARFYILRNKSGEVFAGFRQAVNDSGNCVMGKFVPHFGKPAPKASIQANVIHEDDIEETQIDLRSCGFETDRVQVG